MPSTVSFALASLAHTFLRIDKLVGNANIPAPKLIQKLARGIKLQNRRLGANDVPLSDEPHDVFKVWPTNAGTEFEEVMNAADKAP